MGNHADGRIELDAALDASFPDGVWGSLDVAFAQAPAGQLAAADLLRLEGASAAHPFEDPPRIEPLNDNESLFSIHANPDYVGELPRAAAIAWMRSDRTLYTAKLPLRRGEYTGVIRPFARRDLDPSAHTVIRVRPLESD